MWRKEELKQGDAQPTAPLSAGVPPAVSTSSAAPAAGSALPVSPKAVACISQGIRVKGDIIGKEDLFVDGTLEGKLDLGNASCTIGPNGKVKADITAVEFRPRYRRSSYRAPSHRRWRTPSRQGRSR